MVDKSDRPSLKNNLARAGFQVHGQEQDFELGGGEVKNDFNRHKQSLKNKDTRGYKCCPIKSVNSDNNFRTSMTTEYRGPSAHP